MNYLYHSILIVAIFLLAGLNCNNQKMPERVAHSSTPKIQVDFDVVRLRLDSNRIQLQGMMEKTNWIDSNIKKISDSSGVHIVHPITN